MHTNMNLVNVDIVTVKAANNNAHALMLQIKMGKGP
jgi:hypothetical protein